MSNSKINQPEKILLTAFNCLSERGYANVSMREIADEAGVALSQLHYYYKSKEGLFVEVVKMMMQKYIQEIDKKLKAVSNAKEKVSSLILFFSDLLKNNPELLRLYIDFTAQSLWLPSFKSLLKGFTEDLSDVIERNIINGTSIKENFSKCSPKSLAKLVLGALFGTSTQIMINSEEENGLESLNLVENLLK